MHDPLVVAFEIRRPWPRREPSHDSVRAHRPDHVFPRWRFKLRHDCDTCDEQERAEHAGKRFFPWWKPGSWTPFWTVAGRGFYWPPLVVVWHREPKGRDSGEVCKHYTRTQGADGKWHMKITKGWRWHVHHWRIQVPPLQEARRWLLTRCEWCGGPSRKADMVNFSHQWDGPRARWWQGAKGLYHHDCSSIAMAHRACLCDTPALGGRDHGKCATCGKFRVWRPSAERIEADRMLAAIPEGQRDPEVTARVRAFWEGVRGDD